MKPLFVSKLIYKTNSREMKYVMSFDKMYQKFYLPAHMNIGPYLFGMITGVVLYGMNGVNKGPKKVRCCFVLQLLCNKKWFLDLYLSLVLYYPVRGHSSSFWIHFLWKWLPKTFYMDCHLRINLQEHLGCNWTDIHFRNGQ